MSNECTSKHPRPADAARIARELLGEPISRVERFPTGLANFVYDVTGASGEKIVIRIVNPTGDTSIAAALYWSNLLRPLGVPLPRLIAHHIDGNDGFGWMALERLAGTDLWHVYHTLAPQQKRDIVDRIVEMQRVVQQSLSEGGGFGYVNFPRNWPHRTFAEMVHAAVAIARRGIERVGVVDVRHVARVERLLPQFEDYFAAVRPMPFLDDTTTKNVIIDDGRLSGIVDVDSLCYGDPLGVIALTQMSLLNLNQPTDYTDHWLDRIDATSVQRRAVTLYTALCCVHFLSELGQQYNLPAPPPVERRDVERLETILDRLVVSC